ncbi:MAG: anthranilate synthase component I family protein, partial [Desulfuromonadales bacterium]|nr:anthranilate synthase component I family protein [Desulfuromonadales bacterium]
MQLRTFHLQRFDPLALHLRLCPQGPGFLESAAVAPRTGRLSLVPLRRRESYRLDSRGLARLQGGREEFLPGDPFATLGGILDGRRAAPLAATPFPAGFFGFFAYDLAGRIEALPRLANRDRPVPELWLDWVDVTATYHHQQRLLTLASLDPTVDLPSLEVEVRQALATPFP